MQFSEKNLHFSEQKTGILADAGFETGLSLAGVVGQKLG